MPAMFCACNRVLGFDARYLGVGLLVPCFETLRRVSFSLPVALARPADPAVYMATEAVGAAVASLALLALAYRGRCLSLRAKGMLACGLTVLFGCAVWGALSMVYDCGLTAVFSGAAFALAGCVMAVLLVGWLEAYGCIQGPEAFFAFAAAVFLGSLPKIWLVQDPSPTGVGVLLVGCFLASALFLVSMARETRTLRGPWREPLFERRTLAEVLRSSMGASSVGFALCFFTWGILAIPPGMYINEHNPWVSVVGAALAWALVVVFVRPLQKSISYQDARSRSFFLLPVLAVFLAYFSFNRMLDASGFLKCVLSVGWNLASYGLAVLAFSLSVLMGEEKGIDEEFLVLPLLVVCAGVYGAGMVAYEFLGNNAMYVQIVLATAFIVGLTLISARQGSLNDGERTRRSCLALADRYGLSARELEVLLLLAADYSSANISEKLMISLETVRTHKKRIYAKVGVHKHEELMRLVRSGR